MMATAVVLPGDAAAVAMGAQITPQSAKINQRWTANSDNNKNNTDKKVLSRGQSVQS